MQLGELTAADQRTFYEEQGYLVFPEMLTADEVTRLRSALDEVLNEAEGLTESNEKFSIKPGHDGEAAVRHAKNHVRRIFDPVEHHQAFRDTAFHPRILDAVENLIGPNIQLHHSKLNLKPPSSPEARFEWHQDYPFFPHTNYELVAVLVNIDESTEENGALRIIPESHKSGPRIHHFATDGAFSSKLADETVVTDSSKWLSLPCPAGGVEMHHCNMVHSSKANLGDRPRSALILQYRAADNIALAGRLGPGMMVRGTDPHQARMLDDTVIKLPGRIRDPLQRDG
jgi:ectoine hydroxylase-related dioxygenase (phytanoyl-CoA dioxygenase family)